MAREYNVYINIRVRTAQFNRGMKQTQAQLGALNRTTGRILRTMSAFAALFIARGMVRGVGESVRAFSTFEKGIANINILLAKSDDRIGIFRDTIRSLAKEFGVASQDLLKAGFDIQSAIGDVSTSIDVLNAATRLAVAGGSKVAETTAGLITLMESYGDELDGATDAADLLLIAQEKARASIGELAGSVSKFLPIAAQMDVQVEELFSVYAQLTRALGNTREASTALGMFLNKLLKPTEKMIALAKREWGMSIQRAIATRGLVTVLKVLTEVQIEELGTLISRQRAIKAVTSLTGDMGKVSGWVAEMIDREGYVQEKLQKQMSQTEIHLGQLREAWEDTQRIIGKEITERKVIIYFRDWIRGIGETIEAYKELEELQERLRKRDYEVPKGAIIPTEHLAAGRVATDLYIKAQSKLIEKWKELRVQAEAIAEGGLRIFALAPPEEFKEDLFPMPTFEEAQAYYKIQAALHDTFMDETVRKAIQKQADKILKQQSLVQGYLEWETGQTFAAQQVQLEQYKFMLNTMQEANKSFWTIAGKLRDTFSSGVSKMFLDMVKGTFDAKEAFKDLGLKMLQILIDFAVRKAVNMALSIAIRATELGAIQAFGIAAAQALAPAAAFMATITAGGATLAAGGALAGLVAFTKSLGLLGLEKGGFVPGVGRGDRVPALLEPGEYVIPRKEVKNYYNNAKGPIINISMAGALVMDDPIAVEKLYREHLRDRIQRDIWTGRDRFYG